MWWSLNKTGHTKCLAQGLAQSKHSVRVIITDNVNTYGPRAKYLLAVHLFVIFPKGLLRVAMTWLSIFLWILEFHNPSSVIRD